MRLFLTLSLAGLFGTMAFAAPPAAKTSCIACHANPDYVDEASVATTKAFAADIHAKAGLSCHDCHGGNPDPALAENVSAAMDAAFAKNPFVGSPERGGIPDFCGKCHSSPQYMRRFQPAARVDQVSEYWTSRHGLGLKRGDTAVATCVDCHGIHGMRAVADPESKVYATRVAETCSGCHSDPKRMAGRVSERGRALAVDQHARWKQSVHAKSLMERGDLFAPTCNDCHGNHGATPPGVTSVANVCGQCHGREAELFRQSPKLAGFEGHNEYLTSTPEGCGSCHEGQSDAALAVDHFSECATCHENHAVTRPTIALLGFLPDVPCAYCHEGRDAGQLEESEKRRKHYEETRDGLLAAAAAQGLRGDDRFDWLVDQARALPMHVAPGGEPGKQQLRPEFARLFEKFRIGKTYYTWTDPVTGKERRAKVRRCTDCHVDVGSPGSTTARTMVDSMRQVTSLTARAERTLLAAQRGGVEVRAVHADLDAAVDSQIELEVLVHSFTAGGDFAAKHAEGVKRATAAQKSGQGALAELANRRKGLGASLGIIALVLVGLALKIRSLSP
ncbi:MAG: cytochrome c3 family protein [Thermoanaerobaculia bacterium]